MVRQARMKQLAAQADARWEAKPRVMEDPGEAAKRQALPAREPEIHLDAKVQEQDGKVREPKGQPAVEDADKNDPWAKAKARGPSENWQPAAWSPTAPRKR